MNAYNHFEYKQWTFVLRRFDLWLRQSGGGGALPGLQGVVVPLFKKHCPEGTMRVTWFLFGAHSGKWETILPRDSSSNVSKTYMHSGSSSKGLPSLEKGFWGKAARGPAQGRPTSTPHMGVCYSAAILKVWPGGPWDSWYSCRGFLR